MTINQIQFEQIVESAKQKASGNKSWLRAIDKAAEAILDNPYIADMGDGLLILSDSGKTYHANGICQCKAHQHGQACWHRAAAKLIERYKEALAASSALPLSTTNERESACLVKPQPKPFTIDGWSV